jgi:hypothetical protein
MLRLGLLAVALAACGGSSPENESPAGAGATSATSGAGVVLEGETLDGEQLSLADLRGKPVFVNVWASW